MGNMQYAIGRPFRAAPTNEISNSDFETDTTGWTGYSTGGTKTMERATDQAKVGSASLKITADSGPPTSIGLKYTLSSTQNRKSRLLSVALWVRVDRTRNVKVRFTTSGGTGDPLTSAGYIEQSVTADTWTHIVTGWSVAENDHTGIVLQINCTDIQNGDQLWVDDVHVYEVDEGRAGGDFLTPARVFLNSGTADSDYPVSDLLVEQLSRSWRSGDLTETSIMFDFGKAVNPDAVFIEGMNMDQLQIASYTNLSASADYTSSPATALNTLNGRYSLFHDLTAASSSKRYWELKFTTSYAPNNADDPYWEVARVCWIDDGGLNTLSQNWGVPYRVGVSEMRAGARLVGGAVQDRVFSPKFVTIAAANDFSLNLGDSIRTQLEELQAVSGDQRILHYENDSDTTRAYVCKRIGDMILTKGAWPILAADIGLEEVT